MTSHCVRKGRIIGPRAAIVHLSALMPRVFAIPSFHDARSPKTQREMRRVLKEYDQRFHTESVFAGVIGGQRTYDLYIYADDDQRRACFEFRAGEIAP